MGHDFLRNAGCSAAHLAEEPASNKETGPSDRDQPSDGGDDLQKYPRPRRYQKALTPVGAFSNVLRFFVHRRVNNTGLSAFP